MSDVLTSGKRFRTRNIIDDCSREALAIEVDFPCGCKGEKGSGRSNRLAGQASSDSD